MNKKKVTKKTVKKNVKSNTRIGANMYRTPEGNIRVQKMVDGVRHSLNTKSIKKAKAFLNSL